MDWKEYCELRKPFDEKIREAKAEIKKLDKEYINEHRVFQRGDMVRIITPKATRNAVVVGYTIGKNGRCIPTLALVRRGRSSVPNFFHMHEFDESIVIEKVEEEV